MMHIHIKWVLVIIATIIFLYGFLRAMRPGESTGYGSGVGELFTGILWLLGYTIFWIIWLIIW
jgi:hypothetical protein